MIESTRNQFKQCPQCLVVISASPMLLLRCYVFHKHFRFHWMLVLDVICCDLCFFFHFTHTHTHVHIHNGVTLTYMWELETDLQEDFFNNVCPGIKLRSPGCQFISPWAISWTSISLKILGRTLNMHKISISPLHNL